MSLHQYKSDKIVVTFDLKRCIHSGICLMGLPQVFDNGARPWVQPAKADAESIAETIRTCPSGALQYKRLDGGPAEQPDAQNSMELQPSGPYYVRGSIELQDSDGQTLSHETRVALCRCGQSKRKPFCDNTHRTIVWDG